MRRRPDPAGLALVAFVVTWLLVLLVLALSAQSHCFSQACVCHVDAACGM